MLTVKISTKTRKIQFHVASMQAAWWKINNILTADELGSFAVSIIKGTKNAEI